MNYDRALKEAKISHCEKRTSDWLRNYILSIVDETAQAYFGERASFKCAQSAMALSYCLAEIGIKSAYILGAVCVPKISTNFSTLSWHGFWGKDHHYWIMSEFGEIIDLSISYIHNHPKETETLFPIPPVWINTNEGMPNCFKYLHDQCYNLDFSDGKPNISFLEDNDKTATKPPQREMDEFWKALEEKLSANSTSYSKKFPCLITEGMTENDLIKLPSPYLNAIPTFLDANIPLPYWITKKEKELLSPYGM